MDGNGVALSIPEIPLSSGDRKMPVLGFGTAADPLVGSETIKHAVVQAIELGYRHFDTAVLYKSEQPLGEAIAEALCRDLIQSQDELFITSKLWCTDAHPQHVIVHPALQKILNNLTLEYIDLYLIHWPVSLKPGFHEYRIREEEFMAMDYKSVWAAMEECQNLGFTKTIGVEVNPCWQQRKLRELCKANGVLVAAYGALGVIGTFYGTNRVTESEVLKEIANARQKTTAQLVCLRWAYEQGIGVLVKSFNKERMKQNLGIFELSSL